VEDALVGSEPRERVEHGGSLVGVLVIVLTLGALGAGAIVGLSSISSEHASRVLKDPAAVSVDGSRHGAIDETNARTCQANADAARAAATVYFANSGGGTYPMTWSDLTASASPIYSLPAEVVINGANPKELDGAGGWKLVISSGGPNPPNFACT